MVTVAPKYVDEKPSDEKLQAIDAKILAASEVNTKAKEYYDYITYKKETEDAKELADLADEKVKSIEAEREAMIQAAKFPEGISINSFGITVDGFPLDKDQISKSKLYIAALRIGAMNLGEVKAIHFDASPLDSDSLTEVEQWAAKNDLQLLLEIPARGDDDKEIHYELIESVK